MIPLTETASEWAEGEPGGATGQFEIADSRSPHEMARVVEQLGYEPVWKDWDAALGAQVA